MAFFKIKMKLKELTRFVINNIFKSNLIDDIKSDTVVLLCNGPSLNSVDFSKINYPLIGLNKIYLKKNIKHKLSAVIAVDKFILNQMSKSSKAKDFHKENLILIPSHRFWLKFYLKKSRFIPIKNDNNFYKVENKYFGTGHTVTYVALQVLFELGIKTVYVLGMDHNFKHSKLKGIETTIGNDINHFDPTYFKNKKTPIGDLKGSEQAYNKALSIFSANNREIINIGPSLYNGWPKMSLHDFYKICKVC